jgi:hypothetical protein
VRNLSQQLLKRRTGNKLKNTKIRLREMNRAMIKIRPKIYPKIMERLSSALFKKISRST